MKDKSKLTKVQQPAAQLNKDIEEMGKSRDVLEFPTSEYSTLLRSVKDRVRKAQLRAATGVNKELVRDIYDEKGERQDACGILSRRNQGRNAQRICDIYQ